MVRVPTIHRRTHRNSTNLHGLASAARWLGQAVALGVLASGCSGIPEKEFIVDYEVLYCEGYELCANEDMLRTVGVRECLQYYRYAEYPQPPDCRYDRRAAEACVEELSLSGCTGPDPTVPQICNDVYSGCRMPRLPRSTGPQVTD